MSETESHSASFNLNALLIVKLFIIGVIASATMVVPGVSGSLVLMLLGYYSGIIETIRDFIDSLIAFNAEGILHCVGILLPFGIGVVVGIFAVSKLIEWLFENAPIGYIQRHSRTHPCIAYRHSRKDGTQQYQCCVYNRRNRIACRSHMVHLLVRQKN